MSLGVPGITLESFRCTTQISVSVDIFSRRRAALWHNVVASEVVASERLCSKLQVGQGNSGNDWKRRFSCCYPKKYNQKCHFFTLTLENVRGSEAHL